MILVECPNIELHILNHVTRFHLRVQYIRFVKYAEENSFELIILGSKLLMEVYFLISDANPQHIEKVELLYFG